MNMIDRVFRTILNPDEKAALEARLKAHKQDQDRFAAMTDAQLAETAQHYFNHCERPRWLAGEPVYDAIMAHVIIPEMIRRLRD